MMKLEIHYQKVFNRLQYSLLYFYYSYFVHTDYCLKILSPMGGVFSHFIRGKGLWIVNFLFL